MTISHRIFFILTVLYPLSSFAEPIIQIESKYYNVSGNNAAEIRRDLNKKGPNSYDAYTKWFVRWNYTFNQRKGHCSIKSVSTNVDVFYTMPKLTNISSLPEHLQTKWKTYEKALFAHEEGHKNIGVRTAQDIERQIARMPTASNCKQLANNANRLGENIIKKYNAKEKEYDRVTNHGMKYGAVFP